MFLNAFMDYFRSYEVMVATICTAIIITIVTARFIIFKKIAWVEIVLLLVYFILRINIIPVNTVSKVLTVIIFIFVTLYEAYQSVIQYKKYEIRKNKLYDYLKNSEYDYFIQVNHKDEIIDFNANLLNVTQMSKKAILKEPIVRFLFDNLNITAVNGQERSVASANSFSELFKLATSKHLFYEFNFETVKDGKKAKWQGIIQPYYFGQKIIGRNIYLYLDRMEILHELRRQLNKASNDIENLRNMNYIMMSLTDYAIMYFDFETKTYVATEAFMRFCSLEKKEFTFQEFFDMIHPDDVDNYVEQASTISSIALTRIKFRFRIGDDYYYVMEDSINTNKDADLVSIIRILSRTGEETTNIPLSTKEADKMVDSLSCVNIAQVINKTTNILNTVTGEEDEEN